MIRCAGGTPKLGPAIHIPPALPPPSPCRPPRPHRSRSSDGASREAPADAGRLVWSFSARCSRSRVGACQSDSRAAEWEEPAPTCPGGSPGRYGFAPWPWKDIRGSTRAHSNRPSRALRKRPSKGSTSNSRPPAGKGTTKPRSPWYLFTMVAFGLRPYTLSVCDEWLWPLRVPACKCRPRCWKTQQRSGKLKGPSSCRSRPELALLPLDPSGSRYIRYDAVQRLATWYCRVGVISTSTCTVPKRYAQYRHGRRL